MANKNETWRTIGTLNSYKEVGGEGTNSQLTITMESAKSPKQELTDYWSWIADYSKKFELRFHDDFGNVCHYSGALKEVSVNDWDITIDVEMYIFTKKVITPPQIEINSKLRNVEILVLEKGVEKNNG